jgi:hypothetical protein
VCGVFAGSPQVGVGGHPRYVGPACRRNRR